MTYKEEIINKLNDQNKWPNFEQPGFMDKLNAIAEESYELNTVSGHLAALLIYHQLTEKIIVILIDSCLFHTQLVLFPLEYKRKGLKKKMFGRLISELEQSAINEAIKKVINDAKTLNQLRNSIVHELAANPSIQSIEKRCLQSKSLYNSIYSLSYKIYKEKRIIFKNLQKNPEKLSR